MLLKTSLGVGGLCILGRTRNIHRMEKVYEGIFISVLEKETPRSDPARRGSDEPVSIPDVA